MPVLQCLHLGRTELLGLEDNLAKQLFLRLHHVLVVLDEALNVAHAARFLLVLAFVQRLADLQSFLEPGDVLAELGESAGAEPLRQVEELCLERLELEDVVEVAIVPSPLPQYFPLHLKNSLQFLLDALQAVAIVLVLSGDF